MKKAEQIQRAQDAIRELRNAANDIEEFMKNFIDFDDDMEGVGPLDNIGGDENCRALGMAGYDNDKRVDILFYRKYDLYTKTFVKK